MLTGAGTGGKRRASLKLPVSEVTFSGRCYFYLSLALALFMIAFLPGVSSVHAKVFDSPPRPVEQKSQSPAASQKSSVTFAPAVTYSSGGYYADSIAIADLNGDGIPDIVVANTCHSGGASSNCDAGGLVSVLLGNGDGTFQSAVGYAAGGVATSAVAIADVNGDSYPDLVVASECDSTSQCDVGNVSVLLGNGDGTFQEAVTYAAGYAPESVAVGDLNGDGFPDLVVANQDQCSTCDLGAVSVLLGNGDGTFQAPVSYASGANNSDSITLADLNGEGDLDVIVANQCRTAKNCSAGSVSVLAGNGNGTLQPAVTYGSHGYSATYVTAADLNGDGILDLVVTNLCSNGNNCLVGSVAIFLGYGNGSFQSPVTYTTKGFGASSAAVADILGIGVQDLIIDNLCENSNNCGVGQVAVLLGNGDGTFQSPATFNSGGDDATSVAVGDLTGNGRIDVVTANYCAAYGNCNGTVAVLLNDSTANVTTTLTSSPNPSVINQAVTFAATLSSDPPVPDGETVTFYEGKTVLGAGTTASGVATFTTSFARARTYTIKSVYPGDSFHNPSDGTVKQVVNP